MWRYIGGASFWFYRRYPRLYQATVPKMFWFIGLVSLPFRVIAKLVRQARSSPA
jgi:hypothetical protein